MLVCMWVGGCCVLAVVAVCVVVVLPLTLQVLVVVVAMAGAIDPDEHGMVDDQRHNLLEGTQQTPRCDRLHCTLMPCVERHGHCRVVFIILFIGLTNMNMQQCQV